MAWQIETRRVGCIPGSDECDAHFSTTLTQFFQNSQKLNEYGILDLSSVDPNQALKKTRKSFWTVFGTRSPITDPIPWDQLSSELNIQDWNLWYTRTHNTITSHDSAISSFWWCFWKCKELSWKMGN